MKKVGVVTIHTNYNMGNQLQAYAVMQLYRSLGHCPVAVNHIEAELRRKSTFTERIKIGLEETMPRIFLNLHPKLRRRRLFLEFADDYLGPSETVSMKRVPSDLKERYDFFSVGSDQVWHNWTHSPEELEFFFLRFADRRQRLCLSPSFGLESVPESETAVYREGLEGFPRLSCREVSGVKLIHDLTGQNAVLLPDPTMGLSAGEWERLERKPSYPLPRRYILSYMLGKLRTETREIVSGYARRLHTDVVDIGNFSNFTERYAATGPREFLYLIRRAHFICTNSFHGTVFSIIFRRNFACFPGDKLSATDDKSNRMITLLDRFHLMSRRYGVLSEEDLLSADYAEAGETLTLEREHILTYLQESIG